MNPKTIKILYWIVTGLFATAMLSDGIVGVMRVEAGKEALAHLGYPVYALTIFGAAKILGSIAILQSKFRTIKEWAYAGFTINFTGAAASHAFVGDAIGVLIQPLMALAVMCISYFLWKKFKAAK